jgi:hypothetical protein
VAKYYTKTEGKQVRPVIIFLMSQATALTPKTSRYNDARPPVTMRFWRKCSKGFAASTLHWEVQFVVGANFLISTISQGYSCHHVILALPRDIMRWPILIFE